MVLRSIRGDSELFKSSMHFYMLDEIFATTNVFMKEREKNFW